MARRSREPVDREPGPYTLAFTRDVLTIDVPIMTARYPSRNSELAGAAIFGRKSAAYVKLFATVTAAAEEAVRNGWKPVDLPCDFTIVRIVREYRVRDAMNLGGTEANALTRGGAWTDDTLGAPAHVDIQVDPDGPDRILIIIRRIYARATQPRAPRPVQAKRTRNRKREAPNALSGIAGAGRGGELNGVPLTPEQTAAELQRYLRSR